MKNSSIWMTRKNAQRMFLSFGSFIAILLFQNCSGGFNSPDVQGGSNSQASEATLDSRPVDSSPITSQNPPVVIQPQPQPVYTSMLEAAQKLTPGEWYRIPAKNKISDVFPDRSTFGAVFGVVGPTSSVYAWSGGAVGEGKLLVWGGGHADYGGNEVYTFDLNTWAWSRLTNPSFYRNYSCNYDCETVDGNPVSAHSYGGIQYIPTLGQFWIGGGSPFYGGGSTAASATFSLEKKTWTKLPNMPVPGFLKTAWDPLSERLLIVPENGGFFSYDPATNTYNNLSQPNWSFGDGTGDFDPDRRIFVIPYIATQGGSTVYKMDFSGIDFKTNKGAVPWDRFNFQQTTFNGVPFQPPASFGHAGFVYDSKKKVFVTWDGGSDIWTLNPADWTWKKYSPPSGYGPVRNSQSRGIYGRFRYLSEYGVFIGYNDVDGEPWLYKLP